MLNFQHVAYGDWKGSSHCWAHSITRAHHAHCAIFWNLVSKYPNYSMNRKHMVCMHYALLISQQKGTICDACGPYPSIWSMQFFTKFNWFVVLTSQSLRCLSLGWAVFMRTTDEQTDCFIPCACTQDKKDILLTGPCVWLHFGLQFCM